MSAADIVALLRKELPGLVDDAVSRAMTTSASAASGADPLRTGVSPASLSRGTSAADYISALERPPLLPHAKRKSTVLGAFAAAAPVAGDSRPRARSGQSLDQLDMGKFNLTEMIQQRRRLSVVLKKDEEAGRYSVAGGDEEAPKDDPVTLAEERLLDDATEDWFRWRSEPPYLLFIPESAPLHVWQAMVLCLVLEQAFVVPAEAAFHLTSTFSFAFDVLTAVVFVADAALNFFVAVKDDDGNLLYDLPTIAAAYLVRGPWGVIDIVSGIPWELFAGGSATLGTAPVLKLVRMTRLAKIMPRLESLMGGGIYIAQMLVVTLLLLHWGACAWRRVGGWDEYDSGAAGMDDSDVWGYYWLCLYQAALSLWASGVIHGGPSYTPTINERVACVFAVIIGATMQAAIIGAGADYIRNRNAEADTFTAHLRLVEHRMRYLRLPTNLRLRVVSFYEQLWSHHRLLTVDSDDLDAGLSGPLANDVRLVQYGRMLTKISFLQEGSLRLIERLQCILRPAHFVKNDTVCRAGDTGAWIGIVSRGHLGIVDPGSDARGSPGAASRQVPSPVAAARQLPAATQAWATKVAPPPGPAPPPLSREGSGSGSGSGSLGGAGRPRGGSPNLTTILHVGDHFGEYSFLIGEPRTSTVIAFGWVRLMTLHKEDWDRLGDDLPEDKAKIEVNIRRQLAQRGLEAEKKRRFEGLSKGAGSALKRVGLNVLKRVSDDEEGQQAAGGGLGFDSAVSAVVGIKAGAAI